jgi:subtilisin family serine protease
VVTAKGLRFVRDTRTTTEKAHDQLAGDRQAERAAARGINGDLITDQTQRVIDDRNARRRRDPSSPLKELRRRRRGTRTTLVVADESLIATAGLADDDVRALLARGAEWVPHLEGRLLVTSGTRPTGSQPHHAVPFGPVMKAAVGAEPTTPVRRPGATSDVPAPGLAVAVIDTGIAAAARRDGWLSGVRESSANRDPLDALPPDHRLDLGAGHGTFVAGIIERLAPQADIRMYRGLDSDGIGTEASVASAMVLAAKEGAQIICLSLGFQTVDDTPPIGLETAVDMIAAQWPDVLLVVAAGNFGDSRPCWPAALKGVTAVAGLDRDMQPAAWSSRGRWVDCSTIGEAVRSTFVPGTERDDVDPDPDPDTYPADAWAVWSGTSFAAPQIAGAVAQLAMRNRSIVADALATLLDGAPTDAQFGRKVQVLAPNA